MTARQWYKRYPADFIDGTMGLSLEEKGAYSLCLDLIYSIGGPIPDDARWLAGVCGVSMRRWKALRQALIDHGKLHAGGGKLSNRRAETEIEKIEGEATVCAAIGTVGGKKRTENASKGDRNHSETSPKAQDNPGENGCGSNNFNELGQANRIDKSRIEKKELSDRSSMSLPMSDPLRGPDGVGGVSGAGQEEPVAIVAPTSKPMPAVPLGPASDGFERFWKQADPPKHASKLRARQVWVKTRYVRPPDDVLIACHTAYRAAVAAENAKRRQERPPRAAQSLCHPVTFLLERRWEGFLAAATAAPAPMPAPPDWGAHGQALAAKLGRAVFAQWFAGARLDAGDPVTITVDSLFRMRWIEDHFRPALEHEFGETVRIEAKRKALAA